MVLIVFLKCSDAVKKVPLVVAVISNLTVCDICLVDSMLMSGIQVIFGRLNIATVLSKMKFHSLL